MNTHEARRLTCCAGLLAALFGLLFGGCQRDSADRKEAEQVSGTSAAMPMGMPARFPVDALRLPGEGGIVLASGLHGIELTLAEYNARVDEVPLPADSDTAQACWDTLDRLVYHKVCAAEARLRGYTGSDFRNLREEERQLARQVVEQGMLSAQAYSDDEALTFFRGHPELFTDLKESSLAEPALMMHVKFTLHNERWHRTVTQWRDREKVVVDRDRFAALLKERGLTPAPAPPQEGES